MTTDLQEPKAATEIGKVTEEREANTQPGKNRVLDLAQVFAKTGAVVPPNVASLTMNGIACDSRKVSPGYLFFALQGVKDDGNMFIADAISRGATAVASESAPPADLSANVAWIRVLESRKSLAIATANFFGHPAEALQLITGQERHRQSEKE